MAKIVKIPFATQGDRVDVPVETQADGSVSYMQGYGFDYERDQATDPAAKDIEREKMNALFHDLSDAIGEMQIHGAAKWSEEGAPYPIMALVYHENKVWQSKIANNKQIPASGASWQELIADLSAPLALKVDKTAITDSVTSTSATQVASAKAVKTANDNAETRVPMTRRVNGKALSQDIAITLDDLGVINAIYPVGIVTFFAENKDPNVLFPGTIWKYLGEDRVIRLAKTDGSDVKNVGGADTVKLVTANLPSHSHSFSATTSSYNYGSITTSSAGAHTHGLNVGNANATKNGVRVNSGDAPQPTNVQTASAGSHSHTVSIGSHTHTISGTSGSTGSATNVNITNSYLKLMGWFRSA